MTSGRRLRRPSQKHGLRERLTRGGSKYRTSGSGAAAQSPDFRRADSTPDALERNRRDKSGRDCFCVTEGHEATLSPSPTPLSALEGLENTLAHSGPAQRLSAAGSDPQSVPTAQTSPIFPRSAARETVRSPFPRGLPEIRNSSHEARTPWSQRLATPATASTRGRVSKNVLPLPSARGSLGNKHPARPLRNRAPRPGSRSS